MITKKQLHDALWQAWYHCEFDALVRVYDTINSNDDPVFDILAERLLSRIEDELPDLIKDDSATCG